jgi:hypothetical protein
MAGESPAKDAPSAESTSDDDRTYGGILGAFPYAFRQSDSRLFRAYVAIGGLLAVVLLLAFTVAIFVAFSNTLGAVGGTFTFSRAFVLVVGVLVAAPVIAPVLLVARRHRRTGSTRTYDRAVAAAGFVYAFTLYLALVISAPAQYRSDPSGSLAPVIEMLYGLPPLAGLAPPLLAVALLYLAHRHYRSAPES